MLSKNKIKLISSLHRKKDRKIQSSFLVEGEKVVNELLKQYFHNEHPFYIISELYFTIDWKEKYLDDLGDADFHCELVTQTELSKLSAFKSPNQVLAVVKIPQKMTSDFDDELVLVLDGVSDPGNFGTIIRCADWFGIRHVLCSTNCVELYNPKVVQATMGGIFRVNVSYVDIPQAIKKIKKNNPLKPIYGAGLNGENVYNMNLNQDALLVMGSESHGISDEVHELLTKEISIPRFGEGESLNVAIASAVLCSEFKRY